MPRHSRFQPAVKMGNNPSTQNVEHRFRSPEEAKAIYDSKHNVRQLLPSIINKQPKKIVAVYGMDKGKKICSRCGLASLVGINSLNHCVNKDDCKWRMRHWESGSQRAYKSKKNKERK